ncbi:MAG TPA: glycosyltransferase, partial [Myxococcota bacterium]|nr:glycosyltransferase [Myxococcota bacterium]
DVEFVLIGPLGLGDPKDPGHAAHALAGERNVVLLGPRSQEALPAFLAHCDVALLPLLENAHTVSSMPLKLWEYLAAGLSVVARDLPNLRGLADESAIRLYREPRALVPALEKALAQSGRGRAERIALASAHGWPGRIREIRARLGDALP